MAMRPTGGAVRFGQEAWSELRKVTWPTRDAVIRLTLIVLVISALVSGYIFLFDNLFTATVTQGILGTPSSSPSPVAP